MQRYSSARGATIDGSTRKAITVRVLVYGIASLLAILYFVDFRSLLSPAATRPLPNIRAASGHDWPHLRGPTYDAHSNERGIVESCPSEGPPVLWVREIGAGYSGLIAVGDRVYTQTQSLTEQKVLALDAGTGCTVWEYRYDWPYDPGGMYPGPRSTPTWSNGRLYFASPDGLIGCLNAADGQLKWSVNINEKFGGRGTSFGYSCSPLVEDGKVILPVGGKAASVVALDCHRGETVWASGDAAASYCSAVPITFRDRRLVVAYLQNELCGFDLSTGRLLWRHACSHGYDEHAVIPLFREPYLRTMQAFHGGSDLFRLESSRTPRDSAAYEIQPVRHDKQMSNDVASSVLVDGYFYGFDVKPAQALRQRPTPGLFRCMNFITGEIAWSSDRPGHATIVVADGKLILWNDRGELILARATPHRYEELARTAIFPGEICWTAPALSRGCLYLRSPTRAACVYLGKPEGLSPTVRRVAASRLHPKPARDLTWLIGGEREYPFELPDGRELLAWYVASSLAVVAAAAMAAVARWLARIFGRGATGYAVFFWPAVAVLGLVATPLGNRCGGPFVFTWPLTLFAVHQLALAAIVNARSQSGPSRASWLGAGGASFLVLACLAYYDLTKSLSLAPGWYFLVMFLPAWPLAIPAARAMIRDRSLVRPTAGFFLAYTAYFWLTGCLMFWRMAAAGR